MDGVLEIREHYVTALPEVLEQSAKYYLLNSAGDGFRIFIVSKSGEAIEAGYQRRGNSGNSFVITAISGTEIIDKRFEEVNPYLIVGNGVLLQLGVHYEKEDGADTVVMIGGNTLSVGKNYVVIVITENKNGTSDAFRVLATSNTMISDTALSGKSVLALLGAGTILQEGVHFENDDNDDSVLNAINGNTFSINSKYLVIIS